MTKRYCESCGNLFDAELDAGSGASGKYLCANCAAKQAPVPGAMMERGAGLKKDAGAVEEKLTFRCPGCSALLSSRKIEKRSRLTCPKCSVKVVINTDGSAELVSPPAPAVKQAEAPQGEKLFSDQDLDKILEFGETQPMDQAVSPPAPPKQEKPAASTKISGPQYLSEEDEARMKFLDEVQGPGGRRPGAQPKTLDMETPLAPKKVPTTRRKLGRLGTVGQKHETIEERIEARKARRDASRNKVVSVFLIVLPILAGALAYYSATRTPEPGSEESAFVRLIREIGGRVRKGALAINERALHQEVTEPPPEPVRQEKDTEQEVPAGQEPGEEPSEVPPEEAGEGGKPAVPPEGLEPGPEEPELPPEEMVPPEEGAPEEPGPIEEPAPPKKKVDIIKCPDCNTSLKKTDPKCPWCGWVNPDTHKK